LILKVKKITASDLESTDAHAVLFANSQAHKHAHDLALSNSHLSEYRRGFGVSIANYRLSKHDLQLDVAALVFHGTLAR
jgi:hypothetical protein